MGAIGRLTKKIKKIERQAQFDARFPMIAQRDAARPLIGFYETLTEDQKRLVVKRGDTLLFPMEMSLRETEELCTTGEIQPSHPQRYQSHDKEFKGRVFNGECNRAACNTRGAIYYNVGTYSYYCPPCAHAGNHANRDMRKPLYIAVDANLTHERMDELYKEQWA